MGRPTRGKGCASMRPCRRERKRGTGFADEGKRKTGSERKERGFMREELRPGSMPEMWGGRGKMVFGPIRRKFAKRGKKDGPYCAKRRSGKKRMFLLKGRGREKKEKKKKKSVSS